MARDIWGRDDAGDHDDNRPLFEFACFARLTDDDDCELFGEEQDVRHFDDERDASDEAARVQCKSCGAPLKAHERT